MNYIINNTGAILILRLYLRDSPNESKIIHISTIDDVQTYVMVRKYIFKRIYKGVLTNYTLDVRKG